jgi:hypothetical protein
MKGGEGDEVAIPPCNALFEQRLHALVLSKTLNRSSMVGNQLKN